MPAEKPTSSVGRDARGRFVITVETPAEPTTKKEAIPPLVNLKVTNPITYLKLWWKKIIGGEGIDLRLKIHPLTAVILALIFLGGGYSLGHFVIPPVIIKYMPGILVSPTPTPTPDPWRETAYQGTLRYSSATQKYYLSTTSAQAITLEVSPFIDLAPLIGRKIFAVGKYNSKTDVLIVSEVTSLAVLPSSPIPIPTFTPPPAGGPTAAPETSPAQATPSSQYP